jgi:hypothetical protein
MGLAQFEFYNVIIEITCNIKSSLISQMKRASLNMLLGSHPFRGMDKVFNLWPGAL